jgi:hypothetical protein
VLTGSLGGTPTPGNTLKKRVASGQAGGRSLR